LKNFVKITTGIFVFLIVINCSTKKDAFLNRSYHAISTKYNVLYNGNEALRAGLAELNENYEDNYWERLPIEPLKVDRLALPGMVSDGDSSPKAFEKAEEKAVKAVQKHSMVIVREERNKQIDDAYLLLGKARYYSKRFVPALEAFNYVILNYPSADLIPETIIWQAKTQVRLQNEDQAISNLKSLLKKEDLDEITREEAHTALAMAYVATDSLQNVKYHLNKAIETDFNKEQTARNHFILGQVYREQGKIDSSTVVFQKLTELKKIPYKYVIHAQLEKAKNVSDKLEALNSKEFLLKLIKDRDNRPYLGELYYQVGLIEKESDTTIAIDYFKKSLKHCDQNRMQRELSYEAVGDLYFDKASFLTAGSYYDSILSMAEDKNTKRIRSLIRRRNNLNEVIFYEGISKINDSILNLVDMNLDERTSFFESYIEELKQEEEKAQLMTTGLALAGNSKNNSKAGKWYFYNAQTVGFGTQEFRKVWGNRPLENNWRLSDKTQVNIGENEITGTNELGIGSGVSEKGVDYYINLIPTDKAYIDSITVERNMAYFKLGVIYKEQFNELELSKNKLEKLISFKPEETLLIPSKYHLYDCFKKMNDDRMNQLKNEIIALYPNSKYAQIILNPNQVLEEEVNAPEREYVDVFYEYKDGVYESVIKKATDAISKFEGLQIVPKFELLKAYAIGKKEGLEAFRKALEYVAMNYPNTEEGKKALDVIETLKSKIN